MAVHANESLICISEKKNELKSDRYIMTLTVSSDKSICSAMKDATDCHAIEPEENQAKKNKLEKS